jgi:hypothetical protein
LPTEAYTFLVDIGCQEPCKGADPEFSEGEQVLVDVKWLRLSEIPERDRVYLWAAGLLCVKDFLKKYIVGVVRLAIQGWIHIEGFAPE